MTPAWAALLRAALLMGVTPEAFWRLSLAEWRALAGEADAAERLAGAPVDLREAAEAIAAAFRAASGE